MKREVKSSSLGSVAGENGRFLRNLAFPVIILQRREPFPFVIEIEPDTLLRTIVKTCSPDSSTRWLCFPRLFPMSAIRSMNRERWIQYQQRLFRDPEGAIKQFQRELIEVSHTCPDLDTRTSDAETIYAHPRLLMFHAISTSPAVNDFETRSMKVIEPLTAEVQRQLASPLLIGVSLLDGGPPAFAERTHQAHMVLLKIHWALDKLEEEGKPIEGVVVLFRPSGKYCTVEIKDSSSGQAEEFGFPAEHFSSSADAARDLKLRTRAEFKVRAVRIV